MYYLYLLLCEDQSLYTGITTNLERRLKQHETNKGSKYVKAKRPKRIIYSEQFQSRSLALKREAQIKKMTREEKWGLVKERKSL